MIKTINLGDKSLTLDNNIVWALNYRDQFNKDIIPTLMPAIAAMFDVISGLLNSGEDMDGNIDMNKVLKNVDGDYITNAVIHMGGLEFADLIEITWALAKTADDDIKDPKTWARELGDFPVDIIGPAVLEMIAKGVISSKNLKRLKAQVRKLQPKSTSTTSSSQQQSED